MFELTLTPVDASAGVIVNIGDEVSTIIALFALNEPMVPGDGREAWKTTGKRWYQKLCM